jgi:hypothetical protein
MIDLFPSQHDWLFQQSYHRGVDFNLSHEVEDIAIQLTVTDKSAPLLLLAS